MSEAPLSPVEQAMVAALVKAITKELRAETEEEIRKDAATGAKNAYRRCVEGTQGLAKATPTQRELYADCGVAVRESRDNQRVAHVTTR